MIRYYLEKFFFQIVSFGALLGFLGVFLYAYSIEDNNPPPPDVRAQFEDSLGEPSIAEEHAGPLTQQHLSEREVADYLNEIIAESLSFTPQNYQATIRTVARHFTPSAYKQYQSYLEKVGFERLLRQGYKSGAFLERPPLKLNALVHNGAYKWLFEVPVTVTFLPAGANTYDGGAAAKPQNQRFTLRAQFTRVEDRNDPARIQIEIWDVLPPRG